MSEHKASEFGQRTRTTGNVASGDPELGQLSAPSLIIQQGIDEEADANPFIVHTQTPGIALWKLGVGLVLMFVVAVAVLVYLVRTGQPLYMPLDRSTP